MEVERWENDDDKLGAVRSIFSKEILRNFIGSLFLAIKSEPNI